MRLKLRDRIEWMLPEAMAEDGHGNVSHDWDNADTVIEPAAIVDPATTEQTISQDQVTTRRLVILLPNTVGVARARARWRGMEFEVDGDVMPIMDLRARVHHCEAMLRRITG